VRQAIEAVAAMKALDAENPGLNLIELVFTGPKAL
jgi:hypothetical protein